MKIVYLEDASGIVFLEIRARAEEKSTLAEQRLPGLLVVSR